MAPNYERARKTAADVIQENFIVNAPVDVKALLRNYGLSYEEMVMRPEYRDVSGFISVESKTLVINAEDGERRKRFTMAHELGHWLMHHKEVLNQPSIGVFYRIPIGKANEDPVEAEANLFAAELLAPHWMIEDAERQCQTANELAHHFSVSEDVIRYRLKDRDKEQQQTPA